MKISYDNIPDDLYDMVEIIGIEKFLDIIKLYGGNTIYIPIYKSFILSERNRTIRDKFNGSNISELAVEFGMSGNSIRRILKEGKK